MNSKAKSLLIETLKRSTKKSQWMDDCSALFFDNKIISIFNGVNFGTYPSRLVVDIDTCAEVVVMSSDKDVVVRFEDVFGDKTETPEEKEAFDSMANDSELPNGSEWDGEGLPPVGAIYTTEPHFDIELVCKYSSDYVVVGEMIDVPNGVSGVEVVIDLMAQKHRTFRKPETPQQREERERLERGEEMYVQHCKNMGADKFYWNEKNSASKEAWCKLAEQYRKAK